MILQSHQLMEIIHIEAKYNKEIVLPEDFIAKLPKEIIFFTTVQYLDSLEAMKKQLTDNNISVKLIKPRHTRYEGQILGCSTRTIKGYEGDFVFIGDGIFHPKALLLHNKGQVFAYDPKTNKQNTFSHEDSEKLRKKVKGAYAKFIMSKEVGVLITTKPGQYKEKIADKLIEKYPDKTFYFFLDNTHNFGGLQDFPFVNCFVNTMCERIGYDDMDVQGISIINVEDIYDLEDGFFD